MRKKGRKKMFLFFLFKIFFEKNKKVKLKKTVKLFTFENVKFDNLITIFN